MQPGQQLRDQARTLIRQPYEALEGLRHTIHQGPRRTTCTNQRTGNTPETRHTLRSVHDRHTPLVVDRATHLSLLVLLVPPSVLLRRTKVHLHAKKNTLGHGSAGHRPSPIHPTDVHTTRRHLGSPRRGNYRSASDGEPASAAFVRPWPTSCVPCPAPTARLVPPAPPPPASRLCLRCLCPLSLSYPPHASLLNLCPPCISRTVLHTVPPANIDTRFPRTERALRRDACASAPCRHVQRVHMCAHGTVTAFDTRALHEGASWRRPGALAGARNGRGGRHEAPFHAVFHA